MEIWSIYSLIYALFNGIYNSAKKKASEKNNIYEILAVFTTIAFFIVAVITKESVFLDFKYISIIFMKSIIIAISWILDMYAIKNMSISLFSILRISSIIFVEILSVTVLKEIITIKLLIGMMIIIAGLILVNIVTNRGKIKEATKLSVILLLISCLLSAISSIIDKKILTQITSSQLQFWFLFFLAVIFWIINTIKNRKINFKTIKTNYWIYIMAIALAVGDRFLFKANATDGSKASVITLINQMSVIEIIIIGKILFKEKNVIPKLICSLLIITGVAIIVI